jgi:PadR family transcriptional regulator, regulatory protein PadR
MKGYSDMNNTDQILLENVVLEFRRGVIVLAVLSQLEEEQYGYSLIKLLSDQGLTVDQGTLYPLLRRLESQGLLASDWRVEDARPRRYYVLSPAGKKILPQIKSEWNALVEILGRMLA